jgi:hypothetical protein
MSEVGHLRYDAEDWQAAMAALTLVVGGPTMFARIGMMRGLNADRSAAAAPSHRKKAARKYRIVR